MVERVLVSLDGAIRDPDAPLLYADDIGVLRGDGVFETVLVRDGQPCAIESHLARLRRSAEALELPPPDLDAWRAAVQKAAKEWGESREGLLRMVLTRGRDSEQGVGGQAANKELTPAEPATTGYVLVLPVPQRVETARTEGVSVITLSRGISVDLAQAAPWQLLGAKTLSYATNMAALRFAHRMGADDVIFTSTEHKVLEGPRSTVVIVRDKQLITPPPKVGVLPGTTQRALFAEAEKAGWECLYKPLFVAELITADSIWMLSSITLAARVNSLDGLRMSAPDHAPEIIELVNRGVARAGSIADW
ncbi:aminodeoxychorismate lyase [Nocardia otitidiscaviarum]|uniref:Aminodeoxychorismate lyase n=1 Tax=Nocardia otitidiscaviarum TaxID=1823 RepID=A0A516NSX7_9NOCA|nr:aminodeoxychorismate lyase [Nocardia otitidiscaviarum]MBF6179356.1 aminodeoxychorismate lyase [Nocardia otitidiscaviarum]MCP9621292.1 aminodeoxychorismate lyase [Nocardia otitidiscaviarum]QDP82016.1 aminodeoxychorismate lyase [Nocardia otitidiscaviarum]